jgi:hypothetical protein
MKYRMTRATGMYTAAYLAPAAMIAALIMQSAKASKS